MTDSPLDRARRIIGDPSLRARLGTVIVAAVAMILLVRANRLVPSTVPVALGVLVVAGAGWASAPLAIFVFLCATLFLHAEHWWGALPITEPLSLSETLLVASFLAYAAFQLRLHDVAAGRASAAPGMNPAKDASFVFDTVFTIVSCLLVALGARSLTPILFMGRGFYENFHLHPGLVGFLVATLMLGTVFFLGTSVIRFVTRQSLDPLNARMLLNEVVVRDMRSDLTRLSQKWGQQARRRAGARAGVKL